MSINFEISNVSRGQQGESRFDKSHHPRVPRKTFSIRVCIATSFGILTIRRTLISVCGFSSRSLTTMSRNPTNQKPSHKPPIRSPASKVTCSFPVYSRIPLFNFWFQTSIGSVEVGVTPSEFVVTVSKTSDAKARHSQFENVTQVIMLFDWCAYFSCSFSPVVWQSIHFWRNAIEPVGVCKYPYWTRRELNFQRRLKRMITSTPLMRTTTGRTT